MHYLSTNKTLIKKQSVKKMSKFKTLSFCQKNIFMASNFFMQIVQCVYIVYAKYQMASVKALAQADFPVHVLSEH